MSLVLSRRSFTLSMLGLAACHNAQPLSGPPPEPGIRDLPSDPEAVTPITRSDAEWKAALQPEAYRILREEGTEMAFSGHYWDNHANGSYVCAGCGLTLFRSDDKFESGTGWPSFTQPIKADRVKVGTDNSLGMSRDEVECARCAGHLGHVFNDGPQPTGLRYCMNSWSLVFRAA